MMGNSSCCHCTVCANGPLRGRSCHGAVAMHQSEDRFFGGAAGDAATPARDGGATKDLPSQEPHRRHTTSTLGGLDWRNLADDDHDEFDPLDVSVLDLMRYGDHHQSGLLVPFKPQTMQEREDRNRDVPRIDHRRACQLADAAQMQLDKLDREWSRMMETNGVANALTSLSSSSRVVAPLDKSEVVIGARLGSGGFSAVYEVHSLRLDATVDDSLDGSQRAARTFLQQRADPVSSSSSSTSSSRPSRRNSDDSLLGMLDFGLQRTTARYAVKHLRYSLAENVTKFEKAAVDLTLEARLLSVLDHPNIVSVRGWSRHGAASFRGGGSSDYFLVIDCLPEQLDDRFFSWRQQFRKYQSKLDATRRGAALSRLLRLPFGGRPKRQSKLQAKLHDLLLERLQVAHDVASGIEYLHDRRVMHRDIKACNIGFDADGVAQIFDLGLARLLPPEDEELDDGYVMSRVGTKSCMAPEVADKRPYGLKADVYSFGIVLWEILSLCSASEYFRMLKRKESAKRNGSAVFGGTTSPAAAAATASIASASPLSREGSSSSVFTNKDECVLPICDCWSQSIQELVARCLSSRPEHRPTMAEARQVLYNDLEKGGYEFSSPSHPRRRRSTFRLDADTANAKGHHRTNSKDATTVASAAKIVASMMRNKLDDNDEEDSSTAFNSCTCTASS